MLEFRRGEQEAPCLKVHQDLLVRILAEHPGPLGLRGHLALLVHQLHQRQAILPAHLGVVLAKGRGNMHNARAVRKGHIIVTYHIPTLLLRRNKVEQGLILLMLQLRALKALQHRIAPLAQHRVAQRLCQIIDLAGLLFSISYLYIVLIGVDAERHV